jgi:hypothetical protein
MDGQNLFHALRSLGEQVPYVVVEVDDLTDLIRKMAKLNNTTRKWSIENYVVAWGHEHRVYRTMKTYHKTYNLTYGIVAALMLNTAQLSYATESIKEGTIRVVNRDYQRMGRYLIEILEATEEERYVTVSERFAATFLQYYNPETYNHTETLQRAKRYRDLILQTNHYNIPDLLLNKVFV